MTIYSSVPSAFAPFRCKCFSLFWKSVNPFPLPITPTFPKGSSGDLKMLSRLRPEKKPIWQDKCKISTILRSKKHYLRAKLFLSSVPTNIYVYMRVSEGEWDDTLQNLDLLHCVPESMKEKKRIENGLFSFLSKSFQKWKENIRD